MPYSSVEIENKFKEFLTVLNLGEELDPLFEAAIQHPTSKIKLIEDPEKKLKDEDIVLVEDAQKKLENIFLPHLDHSVELTSFSLKKTHFQALLQALDLSSANFSTQAKTLLSYAASIAKLSSSGIFGIESDSPRMLRIYAYALMKKAHALDPIIFISRTVEKVKVVEMVEGVIKMVGGEEVKKEISVVAIIDEYKNWTNRLLGLGNALSCSAILSTIMVEHGKRHFRETLMRIMPPAWS